MFDFTIVENLEESTFQSLGMKHNTGHRPYYIELSEQQHLVDEIAKHKGNIMERETNLDNKLKKADGETQKYKRLYNQECDFKSDLISQLAHQKSEAKRWEGNYNNLYRQHVQLKRSKGLEIE